MEPVKVLKEARTLIVEKQYDKAEGILTKLLDELNNLQPDEQSKVENLIVMGAAQEGLADVLLSRSKHQEALGHLVQAMTQLETMEEQKQEEILVRIYTKLGFCFEKLGQSFESEKYQRKAGELKSSVIKDEITTKFSEMGFKVTRDAKPIAEEATPIDILLEKGGFFSKKRIAVWFVIDESEVHLLPIKGYKSYAKKRFIYVLSEQPTIMKAQEARVINKIEQIVV